MQTFLPYKSFTQSAACLDNKRLGKQRVEAMQILKALLGLNKGWRNHPATLMWAGHEGALFLYMEATCNEWARRGYRNDALHKFCEEVKKSNRRLNYAEPIWLGSRKFHSAHRSNLLRKDANWYGKFNWKEPIDLPYVWPVKKEKER